MQKVAEFRGCDNLCVAKVTNDSNAILTGGYATGSVTSLCELASVAKATDQTSETRFYDNKARINIRAVGSDVVTLIVPAMVLKALSVVTGAYYNESTGAYIDRGNANSNDYYALGYRLKLTDGTYRYVWRLKGTFSSIPDENSGTEDNQINTQNQTIVFTGVDTEYIFENVLNPDGTTGGTARSVVYDERDGKVDFRGFFTNVKTPDNPPPLIANITALSMSKETMSIETGSSDTMTYSITPSTAVPTIRSTNSSVATVSVSGTTVTVRGVHEGTAYITASAGTRSATTTVTVTNPA